MLGLIGRLSVRRDSTPDLVYLLTEISWLWDKCFEQISSTPAVLPVASFQAHGYVDTLPPVEGGGYLRHQKRSPLSRNLVGSFPDKAACVLVPKIWQRPRQIFDRFYNKQSFSLLWIDAG